MFWILVCVALLVLIYFTLVKPVQYWKRNGVPQNTFWSVWLELFQSFIQYRNIADAIEIAYKGFGTGRYYGIYQFFTPNLAIRDPDLIKQIIVKDFDYFVDHFNFMPQAVNPLWNLNLFFLKGEKWRHMRTVLSPSFTGSKMKNMFGLMSDCAKQFVQYFEKQNQDILTVELRDIFTRFTNDVIATTAFGVTCDSMTNKDNEFYYMGKKAAKFGGSFWESVKFILGISLPGLAKAFGISIFNLDASKYFLNVIKSNIEAREKGGIVRPDMIHLLLESRRGKPKHEKSADSNDVMETSKEVQEYLTDVDIAAQAFVFFLAGFDSVATLLYFMAYELALHPDIQQRLLNEVDDIRGKCGESVEYEDLSKMKYMDMVISETLRKWPNAMILDRICVKPYTIQPTRNGEKPIHLKKGDMIVLPIYGIQRDPEYYPNPDRFDPERFSDENKASINPYTYLPFGAGPRSCIGTRFALMETKLVFFYLLSKFEFAVTAKTPIPLILDPTVFQLVAKDGFWLGLKSRKAVT